MKTRKRRTKPLRPLSLDYDRCMGCGRLVRSVDPDNSALILCDECALLFPYYYARAVHSHCDAPELDLTIKD